LTTFCNVIRSAHVVNKSVLLFSFSRCTSHWIPSYSSHNKSKNYSYNRSNNNNHNCSIKSTLRQWWVL